ncbi:DUF6314 family protein [Pelagibius sp.]|uniref:DUF6314 family protein n=1 Tax=Pelagibius sp. TaxID=1931238 RepID=UPI00262C3F3D|nr:DUF6314 family protein [Pelagibius sp.]
MPEAAARLSGSRETLFEIRDLRAFLEGKWKVVRQIDDGRLDQLGRFDGSAAFAVDGDHLIYEEDGELRLGAHKGPAFQTYRYTFPSRQRAEVCFSDGRPFHDLDLSSGRWACRHLCSDDCYEGAFTALDRDSLRVVWSVRGPRKDLRLDSHYSRAL